MTHKSQSSKPLSGSDYRRVLVKINCQIESAIAADNAPRSPRRLPPNVRVAIFQTAAANVRDLVLDLAQREAEARR